MELPAALLAWRLVGDAAMAGGCRMQAKLRGTETEQRLHAYSSLPFLAAVCSAPSAGYLRKKGSWDSLCT